MKKALLASTMLILAISLLCACAAQPAEPTPTPTPELTPIYASQIAAGTYAIEVSASSSMFRVVDAQLNVKEGTMTCVITMSGKGYGKLYMGTGEQALADTEAHTIPSVINAEDEVTFEVPVEALDKNIDCAAWSIKKESWYDRVLVFQSALIPADAIKLK